MKTFNIYSNPWRHFKATTTTFLACFAWQRIWGRQRRCWDVLFWGLLWENSRMPGSWGLLGSGLLGYEARSPRGLLVWSVSGSCLHRRKGSLLGSCLPWILLCLPRIRETGTCVMGRGRVRRHDGNGLPEVLQISLPEAFPLCLLKYEMPPYDRKHRELLWMAGLRTPLSIGA